MKKLFKLFALALIASSLTFVACTKEEQEEILNTLSVKLNFDNHDYTMLFNKGVFLKEGNWFTGYDRMINFKTAFKSNTSEGQIELFNPYLNLYASEVRGKYEVDVEHSEFFFDEAKVNELSEDINDRDDDGLILYSDWSIYSITSASTISFDASSLKFNADLDMQMFDEYGYNFSEIDGREAYANESGALKRLTLKVYNMTFDKEN